MSRRTLRDYIHSAFFARDKASLAAVVHDAEAAFVVKDNDDHDEPDGDEGGGDKHTIVNIHNHHENGENGNGDDDKEPTADSGKLSVRVGKLEKGLRSIDRKLDRFFDALPPEFLKNIKGKSDGDGDSDNGDDDDKKEETDDDLPTGNTAGAQVAEDLPGVGPELMEADPALKTGPSKMGDAAYRGRLSAAFRNVVQETRARAEVLAPGIRFPTMDAAAGPKAAGEALCGLRRAALAKAFADQRTGPILVDLPMTADGLKNASCDAVRYAFVDASNRVRAMNNRQGRPSEAVFIDGDPRASRDNITLQIRSINQRNHDFWAKHGGLGPQERVH